MRTWKSWMLACLLFAAPAVLAADADEAVIALVPGTDARAPAVSVVARGARALTLELDLPALGWSEAADAGAPRRALSIAGGGHVAGPGGALVPTYTRLVAVPPGTSLRARVADAATRDLPALRLETAADAAAKAAAPTAGVTPAVLVGRPAVLRDLIVAPVTFAPVTCDAQGASVRAATRLTVEVEFVADGGAPAPPPERPVVESFDRLYRDVVVNYEATSEPVRGSYLVICPNNAQLISDLQPLLDWRRRQGYGVTLTTTAVAGTTNAAIKDYIKSFYGAASPPLEFVTLVGDADGTYPVPTFFETLSGYGGEGDHPYTQLVGDDILADINIGRISITTVGANSELQRIVSRILTYENNPDRTTDPGWFTRGSVTGDPTSSTGMAAVFVSQWVKAQMLARGYTQVDTCFSGSFATSMLASLNRGCTLFTYRGWLGMSGFTTTYIGNSTNGTELPFAVIPTCDTGSFEGGTSRSEAFIRAANGGAIGAIGTATTGTHTRYNDCMLGGVIHGVLNTGEHRLGAALTRGKLEMYNNYNLAEPNAVAIWSYWNNLMGDSATECWTSFPQTLTVYHASQLAAGADAVAVRVLSGASPLAGARVALYKQGELSVNGLTDAAGTVNLALGAHTAGTLLVTVMEHGHKPYLGLISLGAVTDQVALAATAIDDDAVAPSQGNGDGLAGPGETLELGLTIANVGTAAATGVHVTLASADPYVTVVQGEAAVPDLAAGTQAAASSPLVVALAPGTPDGWAARCDLTVGSAAGSWTSLVQLDARGPALAAETVAFGGPGGTADPGETGTLTLTLRNLGSLALAGAAGVLRSDSPWVDVTDADGTFGAAAVNGTVTNAGNPFGVAASLDCYRGHLAAFTLELIFAGGGADTVAFTLPIGSVAATDPVGPDRYGYYAFDSTDASYPEAPAYQWAEIDPALGGAGASVGLSDYAFGQDDTRLVTLPFPFIYYGQTYDRVSVCSNGWFAFGHSSLKLFRNFTIPSAGSPNAMVAVFWDDLYLQSSTGGVYTWHDAANHRFVIEWSRVLNEWNGSIETFQAVLYDPSFHPTDTGDGAIVCQYNTIANVDDDNGFATVGLQSPDRTDGLLYTYWNAYAPGAPTLANGRAIRFVPISPVDPGYLAGHVVNATAGGAPIQGARVRIVERDRSLLTGGDGSFFGSLPPGSYTVVAELEGFAADTLSAVAIVVGQTLNLEFSLADVAGPAFTGTTALPSTNDTVGPYVVETVISDHSPPVTARFYYATSTGGGPREALLTLVDAGTGLYRAEIPGQPTGAWIQYWLEGSDTGGNASSQPAGAPWSVYEFNIGASSLVFADDFETDRGWTTNAVGDNATAGIWVRADPNGVFNLTVEVQPENDATPDPGVTCWLTGNDPIGSTQGTDDVDGGHTTLTSPLLSLAAYSRATVAYRRWYTNNTGNSPNLDTWRVEVTSDGASWHALENTLVSDRAWSLHTFEVGDYAPLTSTMRFRFVAEDQSPGSVVEAAVDDFVLTGYQTALDAQPPTVTLQAPLGGETLPGGSHTPFVVRWRAADNVAVVRAALVLSRDGGATWPDTLAQGALDSTWAWSLPAETTPACRLKVVCWDSRRHAGEAASADFALQQVSGVDGPPGAPATLALESPRPNPFNPATEIRFSLPAAGRAAVRVYDTAGRLVATLAAGELAAGPHAVTWRGTRDGGGPVPSGLYFCRLETAHGTLVRKLALVK